MRGPAPSFGYCKIQRHLRSRYKFNISRNKAENILREVASEGTEIRGSRQLCRRKYICPGPGHCWHTNYYNKLKSFRLYIHELIEIFFEKINLVEGNKNNPSVVAAFYVDPLKKEKKAPSILIIDCGIENGIIAAIQCYIQQNSEPHKCSTSISS